jgi:hypothetical protein
LPARAKAKMWSPFELPSGCKVVSLETYTLKM